MSTCQVEKMSVRPHLRHSETAHDLEPCLAICRRASEVGHTFLDAATLDKVPGERTARD